MKPVKKNTTKNLTKGARLNWQPLDTSKHVVLTPQMTTGRLVTFQNNNTSSTKYLLP